MMSLTTKNEFNNCEFLINKTKSAIETKCKFSILKEKNYVVISPDFDGLASFLLYKKYINNEAEIVGTYDCELLFLNKNISFKEMFLLDGNIALMDSFDHHVINEELIDDKTIYVNPNLIVNNKVQYKKCPYNTEILLTRYSASLREDLFKAMEEHNNKFIAFVCYGDNFIKFIKTYTVNVNIWLEKDFLNNFFNYLNENYYGISKECSKIETTLLNLGFSKGNYKNGVSFYAQHHDKLRNDVELIEEVLNEFCGVFNLEPVKVNDFTTYYKFYRDYFNFSQLVGKEEYIVSHAVKNESGKISVTFKKKNEDCCSRIKK